MCYEYSRKKKRPTRRPKAVDAKFVESAAAAYLNRFDATVARLRQVLRRRVQRSLARLPEEDRALSEEWQAWIEEVILRYQRAGLLDDERFAEGYAASLRRRGLSARGIAQKLLVKGVPSEAADRVMGQLAGDEADQGELAAADRLARRRRLGPYRAEPAPERRDRDLAVLARAGFSFDIARRVVDGELASSNARETSWF